MHYAAMVKGFHGGIPNFLHPKLSNVTLNRLSGVSAASRYILVNAVKNSSNSR
jgi:hypothetical protein